jgi:membrane protease YdiL (CAAX protease family)
LSRPRPAFEVTAVFALLLALVWRTGARVAPTEAVAGAVTAMLAASIAAIVFGCFWRDGIGLRALGLLPSQWRRGWGSMALFVAAGVAGLATLGAELDTISPAEARLAWLIDYAPGMTAQQVLLHGFFAPHIATIARALPPRARRVVTIAVASALFTALHAPNPALMIGVAIASVVWTWHFLAHRNLLAVLVSHLVLGATAMATLGPGPMLNLRVGPGALELLSR